MIKNNPGNKPSPIPPTNAELAAQVASHAKSINDLIDLLDSIVKIKKV